MFLKEIYSKEFIKKSHQQQTDNKLFIPIYGNTLFGPFGPLSPVVDFLSQKKKHKFHREP
jgi:hypothetical protein